MDNEGQLPVEEPEKPKPVSFREANLGPEPKLEPPAERRHFLTKRKRSVSIGLIAVGATAAVLYAANNHHRDCDQLPPEQQTSCRQNSGGGGSSRFHFYNGSSGSGSSSSSSDSHGVSRGGFGSTGSAHGGGGE